MKKSISTYLLLMLVSFQMVSAIPAGLMMIFDRTGAMLGVPLKMLEPSPFSDFLIPGLFLFLILGVFPILIVYGLVKKPSFKWANRLNVYKDQHWSWTFSYFLGLLLVLWINVQLYFIKSWDILHFVYSMLGVIIIVVTHLPSVKRYYELKSKS